MHAAFSYLSEAYGREVTVWRPATEGSAVALLIPSALLVTVLLSLPPTRSLFWVLVEPPTHWLFPAPAGRVGASDARGGGDLGVGGLSTADVADEDEDDDPHVYYECDSAERAPA